MISPNGPKTVILKLKGMPVYKTLIVVDTEDTSLIEQFPNVISFETYLHEFPKRNEPKTRIINLCDTRTYLSKGYYCSLLAEARNHLVLPSVKTINQLRQTSDENISWLPQQLTKMSAIQGAISTWICFGQSSEAGLDSVAEKLFKQFPAPILKLVVSDEDGRWHASIERGAFSDLGAEARQQCLAHLSHFTQTVWRIHERKKRHRWDMAILVNPQESVPPSNKEAIARFVKAAHKLGIEAHIVTSEELTNLAYFDALFIRETTAIDHHTYQLANKAEQLGLVVMDDAQSILRCCNKVYLHDAFSYQGVPSLRTDVVMDASIATLQELEDKFSYPLVLKMPEGSFSRGVFKVKDRAELRDKLEVLLADSALVLAQEYLYTDYDWRIGVLNGRAIYACRYLMARNHWQIYNHGAKRFVSGGFETLPTFEVPKRVLDAALRASKIIGQGLYGVDVKEVNGRAYVLEVNDNPSIDHKVEDAYLGDELYMQIMGEFYRRLEARGR